jgi:hypothetical protein
MGERDLGRILGNLAPSLSDGDYYFASVDESQLMAVANFLDFVIAIFRESEGLTIVASSEAKDDLSSLTDAPLAGPFSLIAIGAESDLLAVGLLAKLSSALAGEGISVNAFSAYHHDYLLVPSGRKDDAMRILNQLKPE